MYKIPHSYLFDSKIPFEILLKAVDEWNTINDRYIHIRYTVHSGMSFEMADIFEKANINIEIMDIGATGLLFTIPGIQV